MLKEIGATDTPILTVWNKIDLVPNRHMVSMSFLAAHLSHCVLRGHPACCSIVLSDLCNSVQLETVAEGRSSVVCISAETGEGIDELMQAIEQHLKEEMTLVHALIPFQKVGKTCSFPAQYLKLYTLGSILLSTFTVSKG